MRDLLQGKTGFLLQSMKGSSTSLPQHSRLLNKESAMMKLNDNEDLLQHSAEKLEAILWRLKRQYRNNDHLNVYETPLSFTFGSFFIGNHKALQKKR
jgi:hypothetical protein